MSPIVGNFVHDLVEMAKAMELLPIVQHEAEALRKQHVEDGERIARLEMRIIDLKTDQDALYAKLRSVEAERNDAGFRQLEAEDRFDALRRAISIVQSTLGDAVKAVTPEPTPEPAVDRATPASIPTEYTGFRPPEGTEILSPGYVQAPMPVTMPLVGHEPKDESAVDPTAAGEITNSLTTVPSESVGSQESAASTEGQSAPLPTVASPIEESPAETQPVQEASAGGQREVDPTAISPRTHYTEPLNAPTTEATASSQDDVQPVSASQIGNDERIHGPYFGKRYMDVPGWVSREDWLSGGGTEADYNWRP